MDYTKAVSSLLSKFQCSGFYIDSVYDGDERIFLRDKNSNDARFEAKSIITSVDESSVCLKQKETNKSIQLLIILGNDESEILADFCAPAQLMPIVEQISEEFYSQWEEK